MREQLEKRLIELQSEFEAAKMMLSDMIAKQTKHRETMLRISGAIQVLQEELNKPIQPAPDNGNQTADSTKSEEVT